MRKILLIVMVVLLAVFIFALGKTSSTTSEETGTKAESSSYSTGSKESESKVSMTTGQKNALKSAKSYLNYSAFSYDGLIKQLEFEKYTHEDAVFAADNCGADWNEQAAKAAKSYLDYMSFSKEGLIQQLEYEGFTREQAEYGARQNGY